MKKTFEFKHNIGDIVYSVTDDQQLEMIVTGYKIRINNHIAYMCSRDGLENVFYDFEISKQKNILKGLN